MSGRRGKAGAPAKADAFVGRGGAMERADFGGVAAEGAERNPRQRGQRWKQRARAEASPERSGAAVPEAPSGSKFRAEPAGAGGAVSPDPVAGLSPKWQSKARAAAPEAGKDIPPEAHSPEAGPAPERANDTGAASGHGGQKFRAEPAGAGGAAPGDTGAEAPKRPKFHAKSQQERVSEAKVRMEKQGEKLGKAQEKLSRQKPVKQPGPVRRAGQMVKGEAWAFVHGKIYQAEHENVGIEGAHRSELVGEAALRQGTRYAKRKIREHPAKAAQRAESRYVKATAEHNYRAAMQEHPEMEKKTLSQLWQKQRLKKQYRKQAQEAAKTGAKAAEKTAVTTEKLAARAVAFVKRYPVGFLILLACVLLMVALQSCASSMLTVGNGAIGAIGASTYPAEDSDLRGAEVAYCDLEAELQRYLDTYESTHDYDEYHFDLDDIEHDPYVLLSMISAWHEGDWTVDEVQGTLQMFFDKQYILTESVVVEVRYYTETDTWTDEEGNTHTDTYQVPYDYYICTVTLENFNLSHVPMYIMGEDQLSRYALYMATLGNRPYLFPSSSYVGKYINNPPPEYEVPEAHLSDADFAAMLEEAEKYLGYPYVWGGSSPSTSFDCSGFVSYVLNQTGRNVGRLGAQGLYNYCTPTSSPAPGDLVFFVGTYDTPGVSHCGIYVGDGMMLHCGDVRPARAKVEVEGKER